MNASDEPRPSMKFAFLGAPYLGGVYSVYRALGQGLAPRGIEVRWVGTGHHAEQVMTDPAWAEEHHRGEVIPDQASEAATGKALCEHIQRAGYDGVFVNVRMRAVEMNAARYLPATIRRIMVVHSTQPGTLGPAAALRSHVHATVAVSPRIRSALVRWRGFDRSTTYAIPNGVDIDEFNARRETDNRDCLRVLFLGRIEDRSKGVFWLPSMMKKLADQPVGLTVAGDGPDVSALKRQCDRLSRPIHFTGGVNRREVPALLASHEALIMPSRFEGLGLALIEAMAAGCVPVASRLRGVTDTIVTHAGDGLLFPVGDTRAAAAHLARLAHDQAERRRMAGAAQATAQQYFGLEAMADRYLEVIRMTTNRNLPCRPLPVDQWRYPLAFDNPIRRAVPDPLKRWWLSRC